MSIVILFCSPREDGLTGTILSLIMKECANNNIEPKVHYLYELKFSGCDECFGCYAGSDCVIKDDLHKVYPDIENAKGILFLTPVFFASVPAQAKAFIERAQPHYVRKYILNKVDDKKQIGGLIAHGERKGNISCVNLPVKYFFDALNIHYTEPLLLSQTNEITLEKEILITQYISEFISTIKEEL